MGKPSIRFSTSRTVRVEISEETPEAIYICVCIYCVYISKEKFEVTNI